MAEPSALQISGQPSGSQVSRPVVYLLMALVYGLFQPSVQAEDGWFSVKRTEWPIASEQPSPSDAVLQGDGSGYSRISDAALHGDVSGYSRTPDVKPQTNIHSALAVATHASGGPSDRRISQYSQDLQWRVRTGETLDSIVRLTTGNVHHTVSVARYNRLPFTKKPRPGTVLRIPAGLLLPGYQRVTHAAGTRSDLQPAAVNQPALFLDDNVKQTQSKLTAADNHQSIINTTSAQAVTHHINLFVGEIKVLGPIEVTRVATGNGSVITAKVLDSGELLVTAQSAGSTSLRLWHTDGRQSDYNIRVSEHDPETRVRVETMVRLRVRMVEFRKSALGKLGIDWSQSLEGPGMAVAADAVGNSLFRHPASEVFGQLPLMVSPAASIGVASSISSRINMMASTGDATLLAEPVLSTSNGGSASFLAGGEVPYPAVNENGQSVIEFKEYGIRLNATPRVDQQGNIDTQIDTEISQLDAAVSVQGAPGLLTRRAKTRVNVRSGQTIVLSGLLSTDSGEDISKVPGLGDLPLIGGWFRSKHARKSVSELVIFVTPEIIGADTDTPDSRYAQLNDTAQLISQRARSQLMIME